MIVVDTNLIVAFMVEGPVRALAESVFARDREWAAPVLWRSEMRSALLHAVRHSGLERSAAEQYCARAQHLVRGREHYVADGNVLRLAADSGCTAYDCEFVALAEELGVPLVTFDHEVLGAFPGTAIHPKRYASEGFWGDRVSEALSSVYAGSHR